MKVLFFSRDKGLGLSIKATWFCSVKHSVWGQNVCLFQSTQTPDGDVNLPAKRIRVLLKINKARKCSELSLMDPVVSLEHMLKSIIKISTFPSTSAPTSTPESQLIKVMCTGSQLTRKLASPLFPPIKSIMRLLNWIKDYCIITHVL